jgi:protein-glutamine gamma-glutamyltransferase
MSGEVAHAGLEAPIKTMPGWTGAALAFWGWQTGYGWLGLLAAALLEGGRLARWEWDLSETDYRRIWDFGGALFVTLAVYFYTSEELLTASHAFLRWLPMVFLPIALAQWFGPCEKIDCRVFWWWLR